MAWAPFWTLPPGCPLPGPPRLRRQPARLGRPSINVTSVSVGDQDKALRFYTEVLGFAKKNEVPLGDARWLTVVSREDPDGVELLLEPDGHPAVRQLKQALRSDGIPFTSTRSQVRGQRHGRW